MADKKPRQSRTKTAKKVVVSNRRIYASAGTSSAASTQKKTADAQPVQESPKASLSDPKATERLLQESKKAVNDAGSDPSKARTPLQHACQVWFNGIRKRGLRGLREEWMSKIKKYQPTLSNDAFLETDNLTKNRYDDVCLVDKSRVKIKINPDKDDYIHASFVDISNDLKYICAQGPLLNTIQQFWLMCVQEETKVILQLCQNCEDGKEKCSEYMPDSETSWTEFGAIKLKIAEPASIVPNTNKITKTVVTCKFEDKYCTIIHLLFVGWPDHSVAEHIPTCREVRTLIHKYYDKKPIVAHCSAGIGRTGTFVAIEMVLHKLLVEHDGSFSMHDLILKLRDQRAKAIQNDQQYCFIFRVVLDILIAEEGLSKSSEVDAFIASYDSLMNRKKKRKARAAPSKQKVEKKTVNNENNNTVDA